MSKGKLVIVMVGLPARGKTFLSKRLQRYLEWQLYKVKIFNVGSYRRYLLGLESSRSDFFDPRAAAYAKEREMIAKKCFGDLTDWLTTVGDIAIYDATNVTSARREYITKECDRNGFDYFFVENVCDNPEILDRTVSVKISNSVDYRNNDIKTAKKDFAERIKHYERVYETINKKLRHIKIFNFGEKVNRNFESDSGLIDEIAEFLGCINLADKDVYITRHGETTFNVEDRIGGDSSLTEEGIEYAGKLKNYFRSHDLIIFTSKKKRTIETSDLIEGEKVRLEELNEINSGICDGMSYKEIAVKYPDIHESRKDDKFNFRYPEGESYRDLIQRVKRAVIRIESQKKDVLVIAHRAVNRCLFSYFMPTLPEKIPYIEMPLNRIVRVYHQKALYGYEVLSV